VLVKYTGDQEICEAIWVTRNGTLKLEFLLMRGWALPRFSPLPFVPLPFLFLANTS